jgi:hypothetical protein
LLKNLKLAASRIAIIGNYVLIRPKYSTIEFVAPKEEEERYGKAVSVHAMNAYRGRRSLAPLTPHQGPRRI